MILRRLYLGMCLLFLSLSLTAASDVKLEAIFFDMDGVLVDTENLKFQAWQKSLKQDLNLDFKLKEYLTLVGYSSEEIFTKILSTRSHIKVSYHQKQKIIKHKDKLYDKLQAKNIIPIKNNIALLKNLLAIKSRYDFKVGIVSSARRTEILKNLSNIKINPKTLDGIASGNDDLKDIVDPQGTNKPKPYIYQKIAKDFNVHPQNCIVFEDTSAGVVAAHDAGMKVYAVPNSFTLTHDFSKGEAVLKSKNLQDKAIAEKLIQTGKIE